MRLITGESLDLSVFAASSTVGSQNVLFITAVSHDSSEVARALPQGVVVLADEVSVVSHEITSADSMVCILSTDMSSRSICNKWT
jgi:hypothetical protein